MAFNPNDLQDFEKAVDIVENPSDDFRSWYALMCQKADFCAGLRIGIVFMIACQNSLLSGEGEADVEDTARVIVEQIDSSDGVLPEFLTTEEDGEE